MDLKYFFGEAQGGLFLIVVFGYDCNLFFHFNIFCMKWSFVLYSSFCFVKCVGVVFFACCFNC